MWAIVFSSYFSSLFWNQFIYLISYSAVLFSRMPSNVEIKALIRNLEEIRAIAARLSNSAGETFQQCDTFFNVPNGRLKLREFQTDTPAQLIFYNRGDQLGPKLSNYSIATITDPHQLKCTLSAALGIKGEVKKTRTLFLIGRTRIHLDQVEQLGDFIEFEVCRLS